MKEKYKEYGADFLLLLVAIAWGCTFLPVQKAVDNAPVYLFLFWRFLLASILMFMLSMKNLKQINFESVKGGIILGIFLFLGFAFQTFGLQYTYSSTVAFITGLNVIIVPIFVYLFFKQKPSIFSNIGAIIAVIGLYYLSINQEIGFAKGEILSLICAVFFAGQIALTSFYVKRCNIYILVSFQLLTVAIISLFAGLAIDGQIMPNAWNDTFIFAVLITAIFATVFAFFVQTSMQRFTTPAKTAIIFAFEPVSAGIAGYFIAHEALSSIQIMGAFLIIFGVLFAELGTYFRDKRIKNKNQNI